ncbi:MAG: UDP-N-acetylmuramoyl-L-alanine--D-glutamate ligase, partial [Chloroflexi bacterium]|nr:UDP-N-acetylmuramoyl-L-alanine--D-glutamate ligase [Chloroflexota bacterium]
LATHLEALADCPVRFVLGEHPLSLLETDIVFVSPGVPREIPLLQEAQRRGIPLSTETRLVCQQAAGMVIGITGSSGKTTTTALVGRMLEEAGDRTWVGGNIGRPLVGHLGEMALGDRVVLELSSFQLEYFPPLQGTVGDAVARVGSPEGVSLAVAAILNITPNHLDRHASMEAYIQAKQNIYRYRQGGAVVLSADDPHTRRMAQDLQESGQAPLLFSREPSKVHQGTCLNGGWVTLRATDGEQPVCPVERIGLRGEHNLDNVLAACAIAAAAGAAPQAMAQAIAAFPGVPHRLELVRERRGVRWYNDSIATSPERALAALRSFHEPIVLLAGGRDKHLPWEALATLAWQRVRHLILFGEAAELIAAVMRQVVEQEPALAASGLTLHRCPGLAEAVQRANQVARAGDVVLLSPGGTSFDAYGNFEERGQHFRTLVNGLSQG